ncbi:aldose 1-epimerase family protein [Klenkia brasiliensis]|uniref:Aldose 1-epimerase n=1 Tax=Klenkia brasiliensis TaxID=333142 RepID=A0A1G7YU56_9ACTN|nr:aldose 1-epimerase family protein [Klenkia brasiliensis]SDG99917.1 aldose 1-epimerase [Klenkia brasiliensis]
MTTPAPTGAQHELVRGDVRAVVTEVGGGLRELTVAGRPLVAGFGVDEARPLFRGSVLAPWPNRVGGGRYAFAGEEQQLVVTEPERGHALHGLVCWSPFTVLDRTASSARLGTRIWPQPGWPHLLDVVVGYELTDTGLRWTVEGANAGAAPAPWGSSVHPYLVAGEGGVDDWELELAAGQVLTAGPGQLPTGLVEAAGAGLDLRARALRGLEVDHAFTGFGAGRTTARVWAPSGTGVAVHWDAAQLPWAQVYTCDRPGTPAHRGGLAVEPMTCPPDALNSGTDLVVLDPGARHTATWEVEALSR